MAITFQKLTNARKTLIKSGVSALIIALIFPVIWLAVLGDTSKTPVMERRFFDSMSDQQQTQWIEENSKPVDFFEHLQSLPSYISQEWEGYLKASLGVFFVEYEAVAKREGVVNGLSEVEIDAVLDYFLSKSSIREIFYLWRPILKDPKDDLVLEVAVESKSEFIITFNKKDFRGIERFGIRAVTPQEFMAERGML